MMFLFTDYVGDPLQRVDLGEMFKYLLIVNVIVNVLLLIVTLLAQIIKMIRTKYKRR